MATTKTERSVITKIDRKPTGDELEDVNTYELHWYSGYPEEASFERADFNIADIDAIIAGLQEFRAAIQSEYALSQRQEEVVIDNDISRLP